MPLNKQTPHKTPASPARKARAPSLWTAPIRFCFTTKTRAFFLFLLLTGLTFAALDSKTQRSLLASLVRVAFATDTVYKRGPAIGNLGGVPVSIPPNYLHIMGVEYAGDPHWLEPRKGERPVRTFDSQFTSIGLTVHLPDMKPHLPENDASYQKRYKSVGNREWLEVGILAGSGMGVGDKTLEKPYEYLFPNQEKFNQYRYEKLPELKYGLIEFKAIGINEPYDRTRMYKVFDDNVYDVTNHHLLFYRTDGKITTMIECGAGVAAVPGGIQSCSQRFLLLPEIKAEASLRYPPELLPQWRELQDGVRRVILNFRATPADLKPTTPPIMEPDHG